MVKKRCTFKYLEEILKILKTWKKFRKPGENFQKYFGHPVTYSLYFKLSHKEYMLIFVKKMLGPPMVITKCNSLALKYFSAVCLTNPQFIFWEFSAHVGRPNLEQKAFEIISNFYSDNCYDK